MKPTRPARLARGLADTHEARGVSTSVEADEPHAVDSAAWAAAWGGVVVAAFVNGVLHRAYAPALGEPTATQLSEIALPILIVPWVLRIEHRHPLPSLKGAIAVGAGWAVATVTFEFLFGHYVNGDSWETLRAAYKLADGRLWSLDVAAIMFAPALARAWRRRRTHRR
jgi:hypothetical protein